MKLILSIFALFILAGCATQAPSFKASAPLMMAPSATSNQGDQLLMKRLGFSTKTVVEEPVVKEEVKESTSPEPEFLEAVVDTPESSLETTTKKVDDSEIVKMKSQISQLQLQVRKNQQNIGIQNNKTNLLFKESNKKYFALSPFTSGQTKLSPRQKKELDKIKKDGWKSIEIISYASNSGSKKRNKEIMTARSLSVNKYLGKSAKDAKLFAGGQTNEFGLSNFNQRTVILAEK